MHADDIETVGDATVVDVPTLMFSRLNPLEALRKHWGFSAFRAHQGEAVEAALSAQDCLVVLPTGGGKSVCYQVPAVCGNGLVLVVSPLIALMDDQVASATEAGLRAAALHNNIPEDERRLTRSRLLRRELQLLYVSPERLVAGDLLGMLREQLRLVAVDEAHCVSHWGHDFRPEYRQLAPIFDQFANVPRMGLTATATPQVQDDICAQLGLRRPLRLVGHIDRANLVYRCWPRQNLTSQVLDVVNRHPRDGGIVYAQTRSQVERLAASLVAAGVHAAAYHAGLDASVRQKVQRDFVNERLAVVVATIAFGMGIDRSNVRYVVHANAPKSIEHYQQESGRAGRDGDPAECVLIFSGADLSTHRALAHKDGALTPERARVLDRHLRDVGRFAVAPVCRHRLLTEHFGQAYAAERGGCGACDVCLGETKELPSEEALVIAQKIISAVWRTGSRYGAGHVVDVLMGRATEKIVRAGHASLSVHGLLKDAGEAALRSWTDQLVVQGLLHITDEGEYPLLMLTDAGRALCKGVGHVRLVQAASAGAKAGRSTRKGGVPAIAAADDADNDLFQRLRALRKLFAEKHHVPPYIVFHDAALHALAAAKPASAAAMLEVAGVGERKVARYGRAFLAVIAGVDPEAALAAGGGEA